MNLPGGITLQAWLQEAEAKLRAGPHPDRAVRDAEILLLHVAGKDKAWLMAHTSESLSVAEATHYTELLERRYRGEPIQYIVGETEFYGLPFAVTPDVLIPRPETEHLVERVIEWAKSQSSHDATPRILDIGTGSGAIAVALARHLLHAQITAIDISAPALAIASENAKRNGVSIRLLEGDLLAPVAQELFEIVVSNPPYVPAADRDSLAVEVRDYEPALALFAGEDGLDVYRCLIPAAQGVLTHGGLIALEIGCGQALAVAELLASSGFQQIEFTPDLQGIPRVACALKPGAPPS
jgi:release factor glutamine methyltransferase